VGILNDLYDAMMKGHAKDATGPLLRKLVKYTHDHFESEEAMMAAADYSGLAGHRREHQALSKQVGDYGSRFERGECAVNIELLRFLRNWLTNHIQQSDKLYGPRLMSHGAK
jgi:hemerythrin-like metal-binding protein